MERFGADDLLDRFLTILAKVALSFRKVTCQSCGIEWMVGNSLIVKRY